MHKNIERSTKFFLQKDRLSQCYLKEENFYQCGINVKTQKLYKRDFSSIINLTCLVPSAGDRHRTLYLVLQNWGGERRQAERKGNLKT